MIVRGIDVGEMPSQVVDPAASLRVWEAWGVEALGRAILVAAQHYAPVVEVFSCRIPNRGPIEVLAASSEIKGAAGRIDRYSTRYHKKDPIAAMRAAVLPGDGFARTVEVSEIVDSQYRQFCFDEPQFVDKRCYGWHRDEDWIMLTFYRRGHDGQSFTQALNSLANIGLAAVSRDTRTAHPVLNELEALEERLARKISLYYPELTGRERQVCAKTLAGLSAYEIAHAIGIQASSVLTYRQRAYQKLGIHSINAMLQRLIN